jgi:SAM-dependent methyltransferase
MHSPQFQLHAQIEQDHWWFVARREILGRIVREVLPPRRGSLVVDVGCGTGANIAALAADYRCVGVDTSPEAIDFARRRFPSVDFLVGQAPADLGPLASEAKLFLLTDVLEHVPDDFAMLSALLAAASPGAFFLITVPADMALWSPHDVSFGHYRRYTAERLSRIWAGLPVRARLFSHYNARLYPLVRLVRWLNSRRHRASGAAGTDFAQPSRPINWLLRRLFAGEQRRLVRQLRGQPSAGYARGVSLIALLERAAGAIRSQSKPLDIEADFYDPAAAELCLV